MIMMDESISQIWVNFSACILRADSNKGASSNIILQSFTVYTKELRRTFILTFERGGVVVESRTPRREVLGSIPTGVTVLCP